MHPTAQAIITQDERDALLAIFDEENGPEQPPPDGDCVFGPCHSCTMDDCPGRLD